MSCTLRLPPHKNFKPQTPSLSYVPCACHTLGACELQEKLDVAFLLLAVKFGKQYFWDPNH